LTTEKWRKRWEEMCLAPPPPSGIGAEMTPEMLAKKKRESRRESRYITSRDVTAEKKAEQWRMRPVFQPDEITMTRLGEFPRLVMVGRLLMLS
jgi:hypothetical protein